MNVRRLSNGQLYVPRLNAQIVNEMNAKYERMSDHIWREDLSFNEERDYTDLQSLFDGKVYIVAKGKSADGLKPSHFDPGVPIIGINEAVMLIDKMDLPNTLIGIRQDGKNRYYKPSKGYMIVNQNIISYYHDFENTIPWVHGARKTWCTLALALHISKLLGVKEATIYGADMHTSKDVTYSVCAPKEDHKTSILEMASQLQDLKQQSVGIKCKWMKSDLENWLTEL